MPIRAQSADGITHEFPDGTDPSVIDRAMKSYAEKNPEPNKLSLSDVAIGAVVNAPRSAGQFVENIAQSALHPVQTAENIERAVTGGLAKIVPGASEKAKENIPIADAVGKAFVDRYGGWEPLKKTIANDPVGFIADLSALFGGVEFGLARALPEAAETAGTISRAINPVNVGTKLAQKGAEIGKGVIGNIGTGTGVAPIEAATRAGYTGNKAFLAHMRDPEANLGSIVPLAKKAFSEVALERSADYQKAMAAFGQRANRPLSFKDIDAAVSKVEDVGKFKGRDISQLAGEKELTEAQQMLDGIKKNVAAWKALPPKYRTAAGLDALKKHIGDKIDWMSKSSAANKVAQEVYQAIKDTIVKQDRIYADIMHDYHEGTQALNELEKTLSLGKKPTEDTSLRKLLSTTRSGVNTNFGRRAELAKVLNQYQPGLVPSLAGQALSSWTPQGLSKLVAGGLGGLGLKEAKALAALPLTSPRLVGETAYKLGQGAGKVSQLTPDAIKNLLQQINPEVLKQVLLYQQQVSRAGQ